MANPYPDAQYHSPDVKLSSTPQSSLRTSKRKRDNDAVGSHDTVAPSTNRGTPNPRRSSAHHHAADDPNNAFTESNQNSVAANQFDLSALQAHQAQGQPPHPSTQSNMDSTAAAALNYTMNVPAPPAQDFANQPTAGMDNQGMGSDFQGLGNDGQGVAPGTPGHPTSDSALLASPDRTPGMSNKPAVGSDEWNKVRKDNHKEVERRRRETINEGINELAKIVPGCEKNKGSILQRAVQFIGKLQDDATSNIDKWTFEKLVTEQAISDLSAKLARAVQERDAWKRIAKDAGVDVDSTDLGLGDDETGAQDGRQHQAQVANMGQNGGMEKRDGRG